MSLPAYTTSGTSQWAGVTGAEQERCFVMLQKRLIRNFLTLLVNLINFITLEESPGYTWKLADNSNGKLWAFWYKITQVYGHMATAHFADFWVKVLTKTWAKRAAQNTHRTEGSCSGLQGRDPDDFRE